MDWKIFLVTFGSIFLAELGDKTQLATVAFCTQAKNPWLVFAAAALALTLSSFIAVVVGTAAVRVIPATVVKAAAGAGFIMIGGYLFFTLFRGAGS